MKTNLAYFFISLVVIGNCAHRASNARTAAPHADAPPSPLNQNEEQRLIDEAMEKLKALKARKLSFSDTRGQQGAIPTKVEIFQKIMLSISSPAELEETIANLKKEGFFAGPDAEADYRRLAPLYILASRIYRYIPAPDPYTQLTDGETETQRGHYAIVAKLLNRPCTFTTVVAALFHDIERFFPGTKTAYYDNQQLALLDGRSLDTVIRKLVSHPESSAQVTQMLLAPFSNLTDAERDEILLLIRYHDAGTPGVTIPWENNPRFPLLPRLQEPRLIAMVDNLANADATAFFDVTLVYFVEREWEKIQGLEAAQNAQGAAEARKNLSNRILHNYQKLSSPVLKAQAVALARAQLQKIPEDKSYRVYIEEIIARMAAIP